MSAQVQEHEQADHAAPAPHAFDSPEEVAHAKKHALENFGVFIGFASLIIIAILYYEFYGVKNTWVLLLLAAARSAWIGFFLVWLFRQFSYVIRTFIFAIFFLLGMIWLSMWDSTLPRFGNPISRGGPDDQSLFHPKPPPPAQPAPPDQSVPPAQP